MRRMITIIAILFGTLNITLANCQVYAEVEEYKIGCPMDDASFQRVFHNDELARYQKKLTRGAFTQVEIYSIDNIVEGIDFTNNRSLTDAEIASIVAMMGKKYGDIQADDNGKYTVDLYHRVLDLVELVPNAQHNDGKASLLFLSKRLMQRLNE